MFLLFRLLIRSLATALSSQSALIAENIALRHQLAVIQRTSQRKLTITAWDRALWAFGLIRWRGWRNALVIVQPKTVIAWHRKAYRLFWTWKSRGGRPRARVQIRTLIRQMATENPT